MARYPIPLDAVIDNAGAPMPGASVLVRHRDTGVNATVYQDEDGPGTLTNPLSADSAGRVTGWVDQGLHELVITAPGFSARTLAFDAGAQTDTGSGLSVVSLTATGDIAGDDFTGDDATFADVTITGTLTEPPVVTSLPSSPANGQVVDYLVNGTDGIVWRVKYRAASASPYKWEYVGGAALFSETNTGVTDSAYVNQTSYVDLGPAVTVPLAGDYDVEASAQFSAGGVNLSALVGVKVGATEAVDYDWIEFYTGQASSTRLHATRRRKVTASAANTTLSLRGRSTAAYTFASRYRSLRATPIRVG